MTDDLHPYRTEPDPAFADRLERDLLVRLAAPSNSNDQDPPEDVQLVRLADPDRRRCGALAPPARSVHPAGGWLPPPSWCWSWPPSRCSATPATTPTAPSTGSPRPPRCRRGPTRRRPAASSRPRVRAGRRARRRRRGRKLSARPKMPTRGATSTSPRDRSCTPTTSSASHLWVLGADGEVQADFTCPPRTELRRGRLRPRARRGDDPAARRHLSGYRLRRARSSRGTARPATRWTSRPPSPARPTGRPSGPSPPWRGRRTGVTSRSAPKGGALRLLRGRSGAAGRGVPAPGGR